MLVWIWHGIFIVNHQPHLVLKKQMQLTQSYKTELHVARGCWLNEARADTHTTPTKDIQVCG